MAVSRLGFLLAVTGRQHNPYSGPGKSELSTVGPAVDASGEKRLMPVPVGAGRASAFRTKCVGCMKCIEACPRGILRPSSHPRHFGRPALDFRLGWCRPECNRCAEACPAGAIIVTASAAEKAEKHPNIAVWHPERCVAATGKDACHACERHCPVKAITLVEGEKSGGGKSAPAETQRRGGGGTDTPKVPRIDAAKCIGCGACEHYCPARPKTAMTVEGRE